MLKNFMLVSISMLILAACVAQTQFTPQEFEPAKRATPLGDERVVIWDRGAPPGKEPAQPRLLTIDIATGQVEELASAAELQCEHCDEPLLAPDGHTLYTVRAEEIDERQVDEHMWPIYAARVLRVDGRSGEVRTGPVFARSGLSRHWRPAGVSPDGLYLYLGIPHNPFHKEEHPLHAEEGIAAYNLWLQRLSSEPVTRERGFYSGRGWEVYHSHDNLQLHLCCWAQGVRHPEPGITTVSTATGAKLHDIMVRSLQRRLRAHQNTRVLPAGDGRHYYALRPNGEWWMLDAVAGEFAGSGEFKTTRSSLWEGSMSFFSPRVAHAKGEGRGLVVAGDAAVETGTRLYSSLYLVIANSAMHEVRHESGGGITVVDLPEFEPVTVLAPEMPWDVLALSSDGRRLYALNSERAELRVFDTVTLEEIARVTSVGVYPTAMYIVGE